MIAAQPGVVEWHDVECASYVMDLPVWRELAAAAGGEVLDIGCGTGRVALDLVNEGHQVVGIDPDPALVQELAARGRLNPLAHHGVPKRSIDVIVADARSFDLGRRFALAIAPMQVVQLLGGPEGRRRTLERVRSHLEPGGLFAAAVADPFEGFDPQTALPPLPDIREEDGWVLSSMPVAVRNTPTGVEIDRHRQAVSPGGKLTEEVATVTLDALDAETLEEEGRKVGFEPQSPRRIPETRDHVGSTVVILRCP